MADISKIKLPNNTTYDIKDATARGKGTFYGTCSTAAGTATKDILIADTNFKLTAGVVIGVLFTNTNTASNIKLQIKIGTSSSNTNVGSATGTYYNNSAYTGSSAMLGGYANTIHYFMYDGTYWVFMGMSKDNDTHYTTHLYAGSGAAANAATTNGDTNLTITDNTTVRDSIVLKGILGTDVSSSSDGIISIGNSIAKTNQAVSVSSTEANNWQKIAGGTMTGNSDISILFNVTDNFNHASGLLSLSLRCASNKAVTDRTAVNGPRLEWLTRHKDINPNHYRLRITNWNSSGTATKCTWELEAYHHRMYYAISFEILQASGNTGTNVPAYTLYTDGSAVETTGSTYLSKDVLPNGGTWDASSLRTLNADGITIGEYETTTTANADGVAIGNSCAASGTSGGVAIGLQNTAKSYATALGYKNTASGADSFAVGRNNTVTQFAATGIGYDNNVTAQLAAGVGMKNTITGAGGTALGLLHNNTSSGCTMVGISGSTNTAHASTSVGMDDGDVFVVGNGTVTANDDTYTYSRRNAFRVSYKGNVYLYSGGAYNTSGADYAEFIKEWWDGNPNNEDRVGYMVTIGEDNKLHKANEGDYIIGITSGAPAVIGNVDTEYFWKYKKDDFNRMIYNSTEIIIDGKSVVSNEPIIADTYDPALEDSYVTRINRPEWDYVGMRGVVPVRDDGTCIARGFCKCGQNGIATYSSIRVMESFGDIP